MNKLAIKSNVKVKTKKKSLIMPVCASIFFFAVIIGVTMNNDLLSLMGNSITNKYVCNDDYKLKGSKCVTSIDAYKIGDVNYDGIINNVDASIINDYVDSNSIVGTELSVADVTLDGKLTKEDVNKMKFYLAGISSANIEGYVCPNGYELDGNKCEKEENAVLVSDKLDIGSAVKYNNSIWYILDNKDDYVTLLRKDYINISNKQVNYNSINSVLDDYASDILSDLKEVDGSKIRLITIDELIQLGFNDKTNTKYYEESDDTPYWVGLNNSNYWVMNISPFMVINYEGKNYVYEAKHIDYAYVRPVVNVYKSAIK